MPRPGKGLSKGGRGRASHVKCTTNPNFLAKKVAAQKRRAKNAAQQKRRDAARAPTEQDAEVEEPAEEVVSPEPMYVPTKSDMEARKRQMMILKYEQLDCPPQSEWSKHGGTLRQIADFLEMPDPCDYRAIKETLERHLAGEDVWYHKGGQGRKTKLKPGQQKIVADCLRSGTGQVQAAQIVSKWREAKGIPEEKAAVSTTAVKTAVKHL